MVMEVVVVVVVVVMEAVAQEGHDMGWGETACGQSTGKSV